VARKCCSTSAGLRALSRPSPSCSIRPTRIST
jgi:hypothetical protein